ncbi:MAG: arsenate reductase ArsC [Pseudomonadales bacterium]|nr:arsenate reductase ArsC [Pseudomonadales bacterium]MBO6563196.1 arsenate reductase ArsC [Pseudomonadales bacterium]MBO6597372.1 arsenate reductase ArsC [Pseudomonadales bacterium]MBO6657296.1 arsenate reductase ArsC [Pseudomonadales bacterium]MBO6703134.1 arsenate reductase ArsC [Pseudomonadales bacterium]
MKLLFLCTGNACRSQMAEGWARHLGKGIFQRIASAGIEAHGLNETAVSVMLEAGVDISGHQSSLLESFDLKDFDLVVTVCGDADEQCPRLPGGSQKQHWPLSDPAKLTGSEEEIIDGFRLTRDDIRARVEVLIKDLA